MNVQVGESAKPSGVVTFLFTDVEGSTRRWEADPELMRSALEAHDAVLREAIEKYTGWLFKHTGDGMCAVFASPRSAVDAAVAAQRSLELPVRMGIATGEAEHRSGDYFGPVLNRAARVMACGHGGQILVDGATAGLLAGVDLIDLGPRRLRDIARPVELFQVRADGLRIDFPPLNTVDPAPGNLRAPSSSLVGREYELAELDLVVKAHRLVTLTGVGGVGKTRLALEVAARSTDGFPDGVWVIELAPVGDPAAVPEAVAAVLGISQQPGKSLADSIAAALDGRTRLLVFDNCEHVLDAVADMVEAILRHSATVTILATSREGLRVTDEQLWSVPSLDVESSAATLFVERAHAVTSGILLNERDASVVEICRRLDGIPLAIELAASRMQSMTVSELEDRLDDRFRLLVGARRGLERHQTLRHAVQWSYDLLEDAEKSVLARCSVFAGGFDLASACAVAGSDDELATLDLLDALVRKSLLVADRSTARTRFTMLETIRQFAEEQLVVGGQAGEARTTHARHFAGRETDVLALWDCPRQREAYQWFAVELANLRSAFRWAADCNDLDTAAAIATYATFLGMWVNQPEAHAWAEELIEPARTVGHRRMAQLYVMAAQCYATGRIDDSMSYAEAGRLAMDSGRFDGVSDAAEVSLGGPYITTGDRQRILEFVQRFAARHTPTRCYARTLLAMTLKINGDAQGACAAFDGLLAEADATDNPHTISFALNGYGYVYADADPVAASEALHRGVTIAADSGNRELESQLAVNLARLAAAQGDPLDGITFMNIAIRNYQDAGNFSLMPSALAILAGFLDRLGRYEPAATISGFATTPFTLVGYSEINTANTHLREVLGDHAYEAFAQAGKNMTIAAIVAYAFEQIDLARADLLHAGESP
jgi:predicted ATPase/class 3 adenylate cyclase